MWLGKVRSHDFEDFESKSYQELCDASFYDGSLVETTHPVPGRSSDPCVKSGFGMWSDKIYHFLPDKPPSSDGDEI